MHRQGNTLSHSGTTGGILACGSSLYMMNGGDCNTKNIPPPPPINEHKKAHVTLTELELATFRTRLCGQHCRGKCANADACPHSHCLTWQRRNPFEIIYYPKLCPGIEFRRSHKKMNLVRHCNRGRHCTYAHSKEEELYHPLTYKTRICSTFPNCDRHFCPFSHGPGEFRVPMSNPLIRCFWGNNTTSPHNNLIKPNEKSELWRNEAGVVGQQLAQIVQSNVIRFNHTDPVNLRQNTINKAKDKAAAVSARTYFANIVPGVGSSPATTESPRSLLINGSNLEDALTPDSQMLKSPGIKMALPAAAGTGIDVGNFILSPTHLQENFIGGQKLHNSFSSGSNRKQYGNDIESFQTIGGVEWANQFLQGSTSGIVTAAATPRDLKFNNNNNRCIKEYANRTSGEDGNTAVPSKIENQHYSKDTYDAQHGDLIIALALQLLGPKANSMTAEHICLTLDLAVRLAEMLQGAATEERNIQNEVNQHEQKRILIECQKQQIQRKANIYNENCTPKYQMDCNNSASNIQSHNENELLMALLRDMRISNNTSIENNTNIPSEPPGLSRFGQSVGTNYAPQNDIIFNEKNQKPFHRNTISNQSFIFNKKPACETNHTPCNTCGDTTYNKDSKLSFSSSQKKKHSFPLNDNAIAQNQILENSQIPSTNEAFSNGKDILESASSASCAVTESICQKSWADSAEGEGSTRDGVADDGNEITFTETACEKKIKSKNIKLNEETKKLPPTPRSITQSNRFHH